MHSLRRKVQTRQPLDQTAGSLSTRKRKSFPRKTFRHEQDSAQKRREYGPKQPTSQGFSPVDVKTI